MRRSFCLLLLFALTLSAAAKDVWVGGTYKTTFSDQKDIEMTLMQDGDKVTGSYAYDNGQVEGRLKGRRLTGTWTQKGASGRFEFVFSKDGKSFEGLRSTEDVQPDDRSEAWDGQLVEGRSSDRGKWVLVGKETSISNADFVYDQERSYTDYSRIIYESKEKVMAGAAAIYHPDITDFAHMHYTLGGTAENFRISMSCDYLHEFEEEYAGEREKKLDKVHFNGTFSGGFEPLKGPYSPRVIKIPLDYHQSISGTYSGLHLFFRVIDSRTIIRHGDVKIYKELEYPESGLLPKEHQELTYLFPNPEVDHNYDDLYVYCDVMVHELINPDDGVHETIRTAYHFRWNGDDGGYVPESENTGWVAELFDKNQHAGDIWTILIGLIAASLGAGAFAGLFGGAGAGGAGGPEGSGNPPDELSGDDRRRRFVREDDPDYVRKYVWENEDGSLTLTDPGGGPTQTLYPKYDEEGNRVGWYNQNFNEYDDDGVREWARWRSENANVFRQDTEQAAFNVAEQRAMNEARDEADRKRGSTREADEYKQWKQHEAHLDKLSEKFGIDRENEAALKKALERDIKQASVEGAEADSRSAWWDERIAEAELTEKVCDAVIDTAGELTPQTKAIKTQYHYFKTIGRRSMEGIVDNKGVGHTVLKVGQGFAENAIDMYKGDKRWEDFATLDMLTGGEKGRSAGSSMLKTVMGDLIDGDKDASEMIDNAVKSGVSQYGSDLMGDVIGDKVKNAELTHGATEANKEMFKNFSSDWYTEKVTNPIAEDISNALNDWRKSVLGI